MAVTGLPGQQLAPEAAILLGIACFGSGALVAYVTSGWKGLARGLPAIAVLTLVMGTTQYLLATNGMWTIGATGAALAGLPVGVLLTRLPLYQRARDGEAGRGLEAGVSAADPPPSAPDDGKRRSLALAMSGYAVLVALAFALALIAPLADFMDLIQINLQFPELSTPHWTTPAGGGRSISLFGHTGATLLYASIIAYLIYRRVGYYQPGALGRILNRVARGAVTSSLGIAAMVGMAVIMSHTGMTNILARGLSETVGGTIYPAAAPFIGALGAFITGSNNNSNVLFAVLQQQTAELLGLSVTLILAAQTAGGSLGSIMAPAKVIVGCSTVGLNDQEGLVMGKMMIYGLIPVAVVAVVTLALAWR
jgi:lactate permease